MMLGMYRDFVCWYFQNDVGFYATSFDVIVLDIVRLLRYPLLTFCKLRIFNIYLSEWINMCKIEGRLIFHIECMGVWLNGISKSGSWQTNTTFTKISRIHCG